MGQTMIIKKLSNKFEENFEFLWEDTKKFKNIFVPIENELQRLIKMAMKVL